MRGQVLKSMHFYGRCAVVLSKVCIFTVSALHGCQKYDFYNRCAAGLTKNMRFYDKCAAGLLKVCIFTVDAL